MAKRNQRSKNSLRPSYLLTSKRSLLFILLFAGVGSFLLFRTFAQSNLPPNPGDIVAAYIKSRPTRIKRSADVITYESYSTSYLVLADGSLLCDDGSKDGTVSTGKLSKGQLKQLAKESSDLDLGTLPNEIGLPADGVVLDYEGYILAKRGSASGFAVYPGASKPDKLAKFESKILKACEKATAKSQRGKTQEFNIPSFSLDEGGISEKITAVLSPKVEAAPNGLGAIDASFGTYIANATNSYRASKGVPGLVRKSCLDEVAWTQAKRMLERGTFFHNPNIVNEVVYICTARGDTNVRNWRSIGENVAKCFTSAESCLNAYKASPLHNQNLLSRDYTFQGSAAYKRYSDGVTFHVHVFAAW